MGLMWCLYESRNDDLLARSCARVRLVCRGRFSSDGCIFRVGACVMGLLGREFKYSVTVEVWLSLIVFRICVSVGFGPIFV